MATCPSCGTQVNVDFGMATCPNSSCSLIFMVDADGNAAMPEPHEYTEEQSAEAENARTVVASPEDMDASAAEHAGLEPLSGDSFGFENYGTSDASENADSGMGSEVYGDAESAAQTEYQSQESTAEPTEMYQQSDENAESEYDENFLSNGFSADLADPDEGTVAGDDKNDPVGIQKFDRNAASQLVDGPYYYDVTIIGLDTAQIKDEVLRALADKRFQWTSEDIRKKLRNGRLVFKDLNPVKAVLLVIKIQHIDVEIQWVQKMHTDPSVTGGVPGQP